MILCIYCVYLFSSIRYAELVAAGQEDDIDLVDQATMKDRSWDDWKDENKKGSGNKMNKRF